MRTHRAPLDACTRVQHVAVRAVRAVRAVLVVLAVLAKMAALAVLAPPWGLHRDHHSKSYCRGRLRSCTGNFKCTARACQRERGRGEAGLCPQGFKQKANECLSITNGMKS